MYNKKGKNKMNYETYLPIFSSFDACLWEFDFDYIQEYITEIREENGLYSKIDFNTINIDYKEYEKNIAIQLCDVIKDNMDDYINKIDFQSIYKNSVNISININEKNIADFIYKYKAEFSEYLNKKYTGYDGFISHYSNCFNIWEADTKNFTDFNINRHYLGSILQFIANILDIAEFNLYDDIVFDYLEYITNLDDILKHNDNSLSEYLTANNIIKNFADYIETCFNNNVINALCLSESILILIDNFKNERE